MPSDPPVVVIDDDPAHLEMLVTVLRRAGYAAAGFTNPRDGLYHLIDHPAALAVIDLCMPDLDGLELVRRLQVSRPDLPMIGISGVASARAHLNTMIDAGAAVTLRKPVEPARFLAAVERVLGAASRRAAS